MKYDVVAIGEYLIDFMPYGVSEAGQPLFERNPGGAPVNVAVAVANLGGRSGFIGKVGADPFGVYLREALVEQGVSDSGLVVSDEAHTTMAFVQLDGRGERSFHFARQPGADLLLREEELNTALLDQARICHFGSISMTTEPAYSATVAAVQRARAHGALISYDPNWREPLWPDAEAGKRAIAAGLALADIVKVSEEELRFLTGEQQLEPAARGLAERHAITLLLVTAGGEGAYYLLDGKWGHVESFAVRTVDTTGAGDGFFGALLGCVVRESLASLDSSEGLASLESPYTRGSMEIPEVLESLPPLARLRRWDEEHLRAALRFANAAGALATTRKGAIPALATAEEIHILMQKEAVR